MTTYWFPHPSGDGYVQRDIEGGVWIDVHCRACGEHRSPRLARFVRAPIGGQIGIKPFWVDGEVEGQFFWVNAEDGIRRFRLKCPHRHDPNIREQQVSELLTARAAGSLPTRVAC